MLRLCKFRIDYTSPDPGRSAGVSVVSSTTSIQDQSLQLRTVTKNIKQERGATDSIVIFAVMIWSMVVLSANVRGFP